MRGSGTRRPYALLVGAVLLAAAGLTAGGAIGGSRIAPGAVLDQRNPARAPACRYGGWAPDDASGLAAQTFTAGVSGTLTDVVLPLRGTTDQITVAIAPVDPSGAPIVASPLASTTVAFTKPATYSPIDFLLPSPPKVTAGQRYAILLTTPTGTSSAYVAWQADIGSTYGDEAGARCADGAYPGGRAWTKGTAPLGAEADFFFETYVVPAAPKPATPAKPAAGTISAVNVSSVPAAPVAGASFRMVPSITLSTGRKVTPTSIKCIARLAGSPLKGSGKGGCTFLIPKSAGGKRLTVAVTAGYGGKTKTKAVGYTVRRASAPPPAPPPTPPPAPIAQAGHYAGTTTRGTPVGIDVTSDGRYVTNISFGYSIPCSPSGTLDNPGLSVLPTSRFAIQPDGTFAPFTNTTITFSNGRLTVTFGGRFTGPGAAAGTLQLRASVTQAGVVYECGPISDTWTATRT